MGVVPIGPGGGAALRFLAAVLDARAVVEIGTGTGVSSLWLLRGMRADGVLTTVDIEAEHQRLAKQSFSEAGVPAQRARTISGSALDVLPRLTDGHYDLVFCDGDKAEYGAYLKEALRLLRPGGVVAFDNALWHDRVADPSQRDEETVAIRELGREIAENDSLVSVLLPVGDGLLAAKKEWAPEGDARSFAPLGVHSRPAARALRCEERQRRASGDRHRRCPQARTRRRAVRGTSQSAAIDLDRHQQHNSGRDVHAVGRRRPVRLVWAADFDRVEDAYLFEKRIQGWSRAKRKALIEGRLSELPGLASRPPTPPSMVEALRPIRGFEAQAPERLSSTSTQRFRLAGRR